MCVIHSNMCNVVASFARPPPPPNPDIIVTSFIPSTLQLGSFMTSTIQLFELSHFSYILVARFQSLGDLCSEIQQKVFAKNRSTIIGLPFVFVQPVFLSWTTWTTTTYNLDLKPLGICLYLHRTYWCSKIIQSKSIHKHMSPTWELPFPLPICNQFGCFVYKSEVNTNNEWVSQLFTNDSIERDRSIFCFKARNCGRFSLFHCLDYIFSPE